MKIVRKKISLEQFKSRMPSIIPAYDNEGVEHHFTHLIDLDSEPIVNYGMLPFDVQVDSGDALNLGKYSGKLYSFRELVNIYHELDKAYEVKITDECVSSTTLSNEDKNMYEWLTMKCFPFFIIKNELSNNIDIKSILNVWGTNKLSIQEVCVWYSTMKGWKEDYVSALEKNPIVKDKIICCNYEEYVKRGGDSMLTALRHWYNGKVKPVLCNIKDYGHDFKYEVKETDTHVTVKVLKETSEGTIVSSHTFQIFEPRVRIFGNNRYIKYGEIDINGLVKNTQNIEIIDGILTIPCLNVSNISTLIISEPSFSIPILLTNNISNLGEMTSICEPWESGYEYNAHIKNQDDIDYSGGVMVYYNNDNWILESYQNAGYIYSTKYKEVYFGSEEGMTDNEFINYSENENGDLNTGDSRQWKRYFDFLPKKEDLNIRYYAYKDNKLILNPTLLSMSNECEINTNNERGFCLKYNSICELFVCKYITLNNLHYQIFYVFEEFNPYILIDNNKVWVHFNEEKTFVTIKNKYFCSNIKENIPLQEGECFLYKNKLYEKNDDDFIDGYCIIDDKKIYFKKEGVNKLKEFSFENNTILGLYVTLNDFGKIDDNLNEVIRYSTFKENNKWHLKYVGEIKAYSAQIVNGKTTSRLNELRDEVNIASDNLGNKFEGLMPYKNIRIAGIEEEHMIHIVNPSPNDWLCLPYIPKYTTFLNEIEDREDYTLYWGNMIDTITFTYDEIDSNGEFRKVEETVSGNTELKIKEIFLREKVVEKSIFNLAMNVTYYFGTLIKGMKNENGQIIMYSLFQQEEENSDFYGVKYNESLSLTHQQCLYYYDEMNTCILNYFSLQQEKTNYYNESYDVIVPNTPMSYFCFIIKPFDLQYGFIDYSQENPTFYKVNELSETIKMQTRNGIKECPIEFKGSKKGFTFLLKDNDVMYQEYIYYCLINNKKYYAQYSNGKFIIKFNDLNVYQTNGMINNFKNDGLSDNIYCMIPIKLYLVHSHGTFDEHFDYTNNMSLSPLIFNEKKLGYATLENVKENIYIDRGTVRAMDFHLRLLEAKSLESLEQIGNGFFKMKSNNDF